MLTLLRRPALGHAAADDGGVCFKKSQADIAGKGEIGRRVAGVELVVENPAGAARLVAMGQEEVAVAPFLEARIIARIVRVAGRFEAGVE